MSTRLQPPKPAPLFRPSDFIRMMSLLVAAGFILWAMMKASDPRTWQWIAVFQRQAPVAKIPELTEQPASDESNLELQAAALRAGAILGQFTVTTTTPASLDAGILGALSGEFVPLPEQQPANPADGKRSAPVPERHWLAGAIDREIFLDEDETAQELDPRRRDANARYHLLALAREATLDQLANDAVSNVRYSALIEKPSDYRGQVLRIKGDLIWVRTLELKRVTPGMDFVYQGLIVVPSTGDSYGILFTDLPEHMPAQNLWTRLYLRDVTFDGYFLKVLRVELPADKRNPARTGHIPVLIGHSPRLPPPPTQFDLYGTLITIGMILGVVLVLGTLALWLYRRSERNYQAKLAAVRSRHRPVEMPEPGSSEGDFPGFGNDPPVRRGIPPAPSDN